MSEPLGTADNLVAWRRLSGEGHSIGLLRSAEQGWVVYGSEVLADEGELVACHFRIALALDWSTRDVHVEALSAHGERRVDLRVDERRRWWRDGYRAVDLDGCIDVDVAATPLTNTFPIRRLAGLEPPQSATSVVAWVDVPSLRVRPVEQTYTRLDDVSGDPLVEAAWEYSDPLHGSFRLTVDAVGLVVTYERFAERVR
jgi:uncharacterized protein